MHRPSKWFGLSFHIQHYDAILEKNPPIDWFEVISENYFVPDSLPWYHLAQIRERWPITLHGVSLSIGSTDPLNWDYLHRLKETILRLKPVWVSDHLCWTSVGGQYLHDLLPLPYTEEALKHVVERVRQVQDFLERPILLENLSSYVIYKSSVMTEWDFLSAVADASGCLLLLDINNIYVSAQNHGFDPSAYVNAISPDKVQQFHLAGCLPHHEVCMIDTHDASVSKPVWALYEQAVRRFGAVPTLLERDDAIPPLDDLVSELNHARRIVARVHDEQMCCA